ncbi:hypothetical protein V5O48_014103 [Marasmius crinis-equi]|uniref:F-box domain-containing protein n=1 Tax=Marasmius crinis-equi TaxID=585013 RepID=A0ABR3EY92_9AGAR
MITTTTSSINDLPAEVLLQVLEEIASFDATDGHTLPTSLFACSQVDRRWHLIACTPGLYKDIKVPFKALCERGFNTAYWTQTWLQRSGSHLVNMNVYVQEDIYQELFQFYALLESLIPHVSRLRSFSITASDEVTHDLPLLFHPLKYVDAPALEEVVLCHARNSRASERRVIMRSDPVQWSRFFWSSPKLRKVTLLGSITERPLENLTHLEMCNVVLKEHVFRRIATNCPHLEVLKLQRLHIPTPILTDPRSNDPLPLLSLRSLTLSFDLGVWEDYVDGRHTYILTRIEAPNLEYLEVDVGKLLVDITNVLPSPSSLMGLRRLSIQNMGSGFFFETDYFDELSMGRIEEIELVNTQPEPLGFDSTASKKQWAHVKSILIDSDDADDLVWLCQALIVRPQIQRVFLSPRSMKQLKENIAMIDLSDNLIWVGVRGHSGTLGIFESSEEGGHRLYAEDWLERRTALKVYRR